MHNGMTGTLKPVSAIAFDMDGTLYAYSQQMVNNLRRAQADVLIEETGGRLTIEEATEICAQSYYQLRNGWELPAKKLGLDGHRLHQLFHARAAVDDIQPLVDLPVAFAEAAKANITLAVITHSHSDFTARALAHMQLAAHIAPAHVLTVEQVGYREKHNDPEMLLEIQRRTNIPFDEIMMVEDTMENMVFAHDLGMRTAFIHWGKPKDSLPHYVEFQHETPVITTRMATQTRQTMLVPA